MVPDLKSAVALFVKNEAHDIMGWIAWHLASGVDKIFIYDDHSSDGTFELAVAASRIYNIEVFRSDLSEGSFYNRQRNSYFDAIRRSTGVYAWVALLDGDEYIHLGPYPSMNEFLAKFDESCSGIAMSWCIYGSSSRVLIDSIPVYEAFQNHSSKDLGDNALVKSFVRPERVVFEYENPHKFKISEGTYVDTKGKEVVWKGGPTKEMLWDSVRVNHYICRSMEHFLNRIRRRIGVDQSNSTVTWHHFDRNDIHEACPPVIAAAANKMINSIRRSAYSSFVSRIYPSAAAPAVLSRRNVADPRSVGCFTLRSSHGAELFLSGLGGHVIQGSGVTEIAAIQPYQNDRLYLFAYGHEIISLMNFYIHEDARKSYCYDFNLTPSTNGSFYLSSPLNGRFLTALPLEHGARVEESREKADTWEELSFGRKLGDMKITYATPGENTASGLLNDIVNSLGSFSYEEFLIRMSTLPQSEKTKIFAEHGAFISIIS